MLKAKIIFFTLLTMSGLLNAATMFSLSGVKKVYPVVEISSKVIPTEYKSLAQGEIEATAKALQIDTTGYDSTSLALLVNEKKVANLTIINLRLLIGETVLRASNKANVFAITYDSKESFILNDVDELEEKFEDALDSLLSKFSEQHGEENKAILKADATGDVLSLETRYETNYEEAVKRAKKERKNVLLVLVSNYCPWCRKFEDKVLMDMEVDKTIQSKYVPLILNKEKDEFPKEFNSSFTPIMHFLDRKTLKSYKSVIGYNNKDEFTYFIKTDKKGD